MQKQGAHVVEKKNGDIRHVVERKMLVVAIERRLNRQDCRGKYRAKETW